MAEILEEPLTSDCLGVGLLETFLARVDNGMLRAPTLERHLDRLEKANLIFRSRHLSREELRAQIAGYDIGGRWNEGEYLKVRIVLSSDRCRFQLAAIPDPFLPGLPIKVKPVHAERPYPDLKTCSTFVSWHANREAQESGFDEALLIDSGDTVREGAWSNFFWLNEANGLHTAGSMVLPGVTRDWVIQSCEQRGLRVSTGDFSLQHVTANAKEAFVCSALRGIVPVAAIGSTELQENVSGLVAELRAAYIEQHFSAQNLRERTR
ncbi:MAG: aminotransferase class IV [Deltaproteobacteria bacterium]|nr:aminotransferase class IV [Deltaproteobacteria bacterium]